MKPYYLIMGAVCATLAADPRPPGPSSTTLTNHTAHWGTVTNNAAEHWVPPARPVRTRWETNLAIEVYQVEVEILPEWWWAERETSRRLVSKCVVPLGERRPDFSWMTNASVEACHPKKNQP